MNKIIIALVVTIGFGVIISAESPVSAEWSQEDEKRQCLTRLQKCFDAADYWNYFGDPPTNARQCLMSCQNANAQSGACDLHMCISMCEVSFGLSLDACPIPPKAREAE